MKTFLLSIFAVAIFAGPLLGEDEDNPKKNKQNPPAQRQVNPVAPSTIAPRVQNDSAPRPQFQPQNKPTFTARTYTPPNSYTPRVQPRLRNTQPFTPPDQDAPRSTMKTDAYVATNRNWQTRTRTNTDVVPPRTTTTGDANPAVRNRDWQGRTNRNRNWQTWTRNPDAVTPQTTTTVTPNPTVRNQFDRDDRRSNDRNWNNNNRNWQNNTSGTFTFEDARRRHDHHHHDHGWWRSHYNRFVLFGGGYYYWNNNYWYPAYGYDPYYSSYTYDEPIYGYNDLPPGQVIANVQSALQEQGYYRDAVDGLIGPNTRSALSHFQRDQGLPITAAIDGPTLQALGLS